MKYHVWFFLSLILLYTVNLAFAEQENPVYAARAHFPDSLKVGEKDKFSIKLTNYKEYFLSDIKPEIEVNPQSASSFVHIETTPGLTGLWGGYSDMVYGTIYADRDIPVDRIFVSVSFSAKNSRGEIMLLSNPENNAVIKIGKENSIPVKNTVKKSESLPSPLQQFRSGTQPDEIICHDGLDLIIKSNHSHYPICVMPATKSKMIQRGLALPVQIARSSDIATRNGNLFSQQSLQIVELNEAHYVGQRIEFTIKFNGTGYGCGYPEIEIKDSQHQRVWKSNPSVVLCDPDMKIGHIEKEWKIGDAPLEIPVINKAGPYTMFVSFGDVIVQRDFWIIPQIVDVAVYSDNMEKSYSPDVIKVKIGYNNTVRWINYGNTPAKIEADNATDLSFFETTNFDVNKNNFFGPGKSFQFSFDREGTFGYHGQPWQRGTVTVLPPDDAEIQIQIQPPNNPEDHEYSIKVAARKGYFVSWTNIDNKTHTVTSIDGGRTFDSGPLANRSVTYSLDTSSMKAGYYQYYDKLNPDLSDVFRVIDPEKLDDKKLIDITKSLKEVQAFLTKYPSAFVHIDHDYYDMVSYGMINNTSDSYRNLWLRVIFDESGNVQRTLVDCGYGGVTLEAPNALEYLKIEKCLEHQTSN